MNRNLLASSPVYCSTAVVQYLNLFQRCAEDDVNRKEEVVRYKNTVFKKHDGIEFAIRQNAQSLTYKWRNGRLPYIYVRVD